MDYDNDIDDVTEAQVASQANSPKMGSSAGSVKTSPYFYSGTMASLCPPHPQVASIAGKIAAQSGHPNKFATRDK